MGTTIIITSILALTAGPGPSAADDFDRLMQQGREAFLAADITRAAESWEKACAPALMNGYALARIAACNHHLATVENARGHAAQAEAQYQRALAAWEQSGEAYLPQYSVTLMNLGELYRRQRRTAEAQKQLLRAVAAAQRIESQHPEAYPEALARLGGLYGESDQPERGRPLLTEAIEKFGRLAAREDAELGYAHNSLGMIELASGHLRAGESNLREAVALATSSLGENHPETATWQINLALALVLEGQFERSEPLLRRARFLVETRAATGAGEPDSRLGTIFAELSAAAAGQDKLALAEEYAQQELSVITRQAAPDATAMALAQVNLANLYLRQRKTDDAEKYARGCGHGAPGRHRRTYTGRRNPAPGRVARDAAIMARSRNLIPGGHRFVRKQAGAE